MPDVSVVIPTCRRPRLVVEAVRSALAQDGASVEVIVLDDSPLRDSTPVAYAYERIYDGYRARHGRAELLALKVLGKAVLPWI